MDLVTRSMSKCLDKKLILFGFEIFDIFVIFLTLALLNFLFGNSNYKILLVWLPVAALAATLRLGKRGKPEKFILHWLKYQFKPGIYSAFPAPTKTMTIKRRRL